MALVEVPAGLKIRETKHWRLLPTTISTPRGLDGRRQFISREARVWQGEYYVRGAWNEMQGAWMAFLASVKGAANTFVLPVYTASAAARSSDEALFWADGENFAFADSSDNMLVLDAGTETVAVATAAPAGATMLALEGAAGGFLNLGDMISINDFLYIVTASGSETISIDPPLRQAAADGDQVKIADPSIRVRFADDDAALAAHDFQRRGGPFRINVVEAFER